MKQMPQISEKTGVSCDYANEVSSKILCIELEPETAVEEIRKYPVRHYEQRFPPSVYVDVITEKNKERVQKLNEIADAVNALAAGKKPNLETIKTLLYEAMAIIYGKRKG